MVKMEKFIVYRLKNDKLGKEIEKIGKFVNGELKQGKKIFDYSGYKLEQNGNFVNDEFKNGKEIVYKLHNNKLVKDSEAIGNFVDDLLKKRNKNCLW